MVSVLTLHYEIEKALNLLHSGWDKDISAVDIDSYINQSKDLILERYDEIVEKNRVLEKHLRHLEVSDKPLKVLNKGDKYDTFALPDDYYNYMRLSIEACCTNCQCDEPQEFLTLQYSQQDDLNESLKDPHRNPSWEWRRSLWNVDQKGINIYHKGFDIKKAYLTYIKWIEDVAAPTLVTDKAYVASDGITTHTENKHLNLDPKGALWRKVVEVAIYKIRRDLDQNYQTTLESIMFDENVAVS